MGAKEVFHVLAVVAVLLFVGHLYNVGEIPQFVGLFFIVVALLKLQDLDGFVKAFSKHDIIARQSATYARVYPFIELALGLAFLANAQLLLTASVTLILMAVGLVGVIQNFLYDERHIVCKCLGSWVALPLTRFTLAENLIIGFMSVLVLFF